MTTPLSPAQIAKLQRLLPEVVELIHDIHHDRLMLTCNGGFARKEVLETEIPYLISLAEAELNGVENIFAKREYVFNLMNQVGVSPDMHGKWSFIQDFALLSANPAQRIDALPEPS